MHEPKPTPPAFEEVSVERRTTLRGISKDLFGREHLAQVVLAIETMGDDPDKAFTMKDLESRTDHELSNLNLEVDRLLLMGVLREWRQPGEGRRRHFSVAAAAFLAALCSHINAAESAAPTIAEANG